MIGRKFIAPAMLIIVLHGFPDSPALATEANTSPKLAISGFDPSLSLGWAPDFGPPAGTHLGRSILVMGFYLLEDSPPLQGQLAPWLRFARGFFLELALVTSALTLDHELFGHGYRAADLGMKDVSYSWGLPAPYYLLTGKSMGMTHLPPAGSDRREELLDLAGLDENMAFADLVAKTDLQEATLHRNPLNSYAVARLVLLLYALGDLRSPHDGDLWAVRSRRARLHDGSLSLSPLSEQELLLKSTLLLADPLVLAAVWSDLLYVLRGQNSAYLSWIILPRLTYRLWPFGESYGIDFLLRAGHPVSRASFFALRHAQWDGGGGEFAASWPTAAGILLLEGGSALQRTLPEGSALPDSRKFTGYARTGLRWGMQGQWFLEMSTGWKTAGYWPTLPLEGGPLAAISAGGSL